MLYLHIGSAKAGSTSIQAFLDEYRDRLPYGQIKAWGLGNSWKIGASSGTKISHDFWVVKAQTLTEERYQNLSGQLWKDVRREVEQAPHKTFVASSEQILAQIGSERAALERLKKELLDIFGEVKLIVYLRDQVSYIKSLYSQSVKGSMSDTLSYEQYILNFEHLADAVRYADRIEKWVSIFGEDRIDKCVFARENFVDRSLISDFLSRIDVQDREIYLTGNDRVANKSPSYSEIDILRRLNKTSFLKRRHARRLASFLQKFRPVEDFPQDFDARILEIVSEGNARLNEMYFRDLPVKLPVA